VIADPWLDTTWIQNSSQWTDHAWTYTTSFTVSAAVLAKTSTTLLTFDGAERVFLTEMYTLEDAVGSTPLLRLKRAGM
jgi:hypothetical protein